MPSLNPDIRRAAADQLLSLAPDPRFAQSLSDTTVLHTLLGELTSTDNGPGCYEEFAEATEPHEAQGVSSCSSAFQDVPMRNCQSLACTCWWLLCSTAQKQRRCCYKALTGQQTVWTETFV